MPDKYITLSKSLIQKYLPVLEHIPAYSFGQKNPRPVWQIRKEYDPPSPNPRTYAVIGLFLSDLWERLGQHAKTRRLERHAAAIATDMFYGKFYRSNKLDGDTLEALVDSHSIVCTMPEDIAEAFGTTRPRGPPAVPRVQGLYCQCPLNGGRVYDYCECDFDIPCDCTEDECDEYCKAEKREIVAHMLDDERMSAFSTASPEERNIACYCDGEPLYLQPPKEPNPNEDYSYPVRVEDDYGEYSLWLDANKWPETLCYDGGDENYAGRFLANDASIGGKLIEAGIRKREDYDADEADEADDD